MLHESFLTFCDEVIKKYQSLALTNQKRSQGKGDSLQINVPCVENLKKIIGHSQKLMGFLYKQKRKKYFANIKIKHYLH